MPGQRGKTGKAGRIERVEDGEVAVYEEREKTCQGEQGEELRVRHRYAVD